MMYAAFERALTIAKGWVREHPTSFPPVVINITGGNFASNDMTPVVLRIAELETQDGNALIFNCHISEREEAVVIYPGPTRTASFSKQMCQVYDISSVLPESVRQRALDRGCDVELATRGYALNVDAASFVIDIAQVGRTRIARPLD